MAYLDPVGNFARVTVSGVVNQGSTSITLQSGDGSLLPAVGSGIGNYNMVLWNFTDFPDPKDDPLKEIVRVTGKSVDTLSVLRGQESTADVNHNISAKIYRMHLAFTKRLWQQIEDKLNNLERTGFRAIWGGGSLSTILTKLVFPAELFDVGSEYDPSTSVYTPSKTTLLYCSVQIYAGLAAGARIELYIKEVVSGFFHLFSVAHNFGGSTLNVVANCSGIIKINAGVSIAAYGLSTVSGTFPFTNSEDTWFSVNGIGIDQRQ